MLLNHWGIPLMLSNDKSGIKNPFIAEGKILKHLIKRY